LWHPLFSNYLICNDQYMPWGIKVTNNGRVISKTCYTKHKDLWILKVTVGKTFDPLNGHHIPCNLVAHNMLTVPIPWDPRILFSCFCCRGLGVSI
jgi:hypothetical protein